MNSPLLRWTSSRSRQSIRSHITFRSRLGGMAMAIITALTLTPAVVPVQAQNLAKASPPPQMKLDSSPLQRTTGAVTSFAPIVDKVGPSVVTIFTTKTVKEDANPMLRRFFGIPDDSDGGERGKVMGLGSGVIVSADGLILTNNHVAEAGDEIMVRIGEHGREYKATKVGNDPTSDLALLRIDAKDLPVITFADSDKVKVGDVVLAVGNPFGLTNSVTMGIVSALGRAEGIADYENFIQTDASINPGNSGGALVDTEGRLIGINTAIFSQSGGGEGIGFAVPSNLARNVVDSLLKSGKVTRGFLGTVVQELTPDLAEQFKVPDNQQGALVSEVSSDGAAKKAGLQSGDIITAINGKPVLDPHGLRLVIGAMNPGTKVTVTYLRDGQSRTSEVTLGAEPTQGGLSENTPQEGKSNVLDGVTVGDIDSSSRAELRIPDDVKGVLVTDVASDSVGFDAGLRKGDVIIEMDRKPLTSADQAVTEGNKIDKNDRVLLHVWSKGKTEYLVLKPKD